MVKLLAFKSSLRKRRDSRIENVRETQYPPRLNVESGIESNISPGEQYDTEKRIEATAATMFAVTAVRKRTRNDHYLLRLLCGCIHHDALYRRRCTVAQHSPSKDERDPFECAHGDIEVGKFISDR